MCTKSATKKELRLALIKWYQENAHKLLSSSVNKHKKDQKVKRIFIKNQKTRWGSCSQSGNLSFNWRLVMAPQPVIDYIVQHELTHMEIPNHSKTFWLKVKSKEPKYRSYEEYLRENGPRMIL